MGNSPMSEHKQEIVSKNRIRENRAPESTAGASGNRHSHPYKWLILLICTVILSCIFLYKLKNVNKEEINKKDSDTPKIELTKEDSKLDCKFIKEIKLDGDFSDWAGVKAIELTDANNIVHKTRDWRGKNDFSAQVYLGWDNEYLYLGCGVVDNKIVQDNKNEAMWKGDHVEIWISLDDEKYYQFGISPGNFKNVKPSIVCWERDIPLDGIIYKTKKTEKGWNVEAAFPASLFGTKFLENKDIKICMCPSDTDIESVIRDDLKNNQKAISKLIRKCSENGIRVEFLASGNAWESSNQEEALQEIDEVIAYNNSVEQTARFCAVHYDLEPFSHIDSKYNDNIAKMLVGLLKRTKEKIKSAGSDMELWVDAFWWWDGKDYNDFNKKIFDAADGVTLMDYKDTSELIINNVKNTVDYAEKTGKRFKIGVETLDVSRFFKDSPSNTFFEEGGKYMEKELKKVDDFFCDYKMYEGIAVHYYRSYRELKDKNNIVEFQTTGRKHDRSMWIWNEDGYADEILDNNAVMEEMIKFCLEPHGSSSLIMTIFFDACPYQLGKSEQEIMLATSREYKWGKPLTFNKMVLRK